ncbi:acyl-CoA N-acyltransferase [Cytidiella melzeri]|nr:acyl-CoA N-acyltransferase [Cytidiella melzeri]
MTHCLLFVVVENRETQEAMGFTLLAQRNPLDRNAEIGVALSQKWWGQGFGTEVMDWLIQYAFSGLALHRLSLYVWSSNERAVTMYEHLGFQNEGRIREAVWKEGKFVDKIWMGLLARDYHAAKSAA